MTGITPVQENKCTLARLVGIHEDQAAERLDRTVIITHDEVATPFAHELRTQLDRTIRVVDGGDCDFEVIIGTASAVSEAQHLYVTLGADRVCLSDSSLEFSGGPAALHGVQTMITACFVAGAVLQRVIVGLPGPISDPFILRFDAIGATRAVLDRPIALDDAVLAGAGAIGNGFLRAARHLDISGTLTVVDPKRVGRGNPNRCLYFDESDVDLPKASRLCTKAQPDFPSLRLEAADMPFEELRKLRGRVRRVIVGVDSRPVRRSIQKGLSLQVLDASTTDVTEIILHSHRQPTTGACLACIYKHIPDELARTRDIASGLGIDLADIIPGGLIDERVAAKIFAVHPQLTPSELVGIAFDSLFKQLCGEQALLSPAGAQVLAPFAFVSNLAGALLAVELARFDAGQEIAATSNYLCLSPWAPPHSRVRSWRDREPECEFSNDPASLAALRTVWPEHDL
jgi:E1 N-terminal domain/ThiF family